MTITSDMNNLNHNRLRWACRRGMLELDLFLLPFFTEQFKRLTEEQQVQFAKLLECSDQELYVWLKGSAECQDKELVPMIRRIRDYAQTRDRTQTIL